MINLSIKKYNVLEQYTYVRKNRATKFVAELLNQFYIA